MPCSIDNLKYGDKVTFEAKHIIQVDFSEYGSAYFRGEDGGFVNLEG